MQKVLIIGDGSLGLAVAEKLAIEKVECEIVALEDAIRTAKAIHIRNYFEELPVLPSEIKCGKQLRRERRKAKRKK